MWYNINLSLLYGGGRRGRGQWRPTKASHSRTHLRLSFRKWPNFPSHHRFFPRSHVNHPTFSIDFVQFLRISVDVLELRSFRVSVSDSGLSHVYWVDLLPKKKNGFFNFFFFFLTWVSCGDLTVMNWLLLCMISSSDARVIWYCYHCFHERSIYLFELIVFGQFGIGVYERRSYLWGLIVSDDLGIDVCDSRSYLVELIVFLTN